MHQFDDKIKVYYIKLRSIIKNIIPVKNYSLIEDYVQDCMVYLFRKLKEDPSKDFNSSYLKSLAIKTCVDSVRRSSTNIKYYCSVCRTFVNRKEKAINCCFKEKAKIGYSGGAFFGVAYCEVSLNYLNLLDNNNNLLINNKYNPEDFVLDNFVLDKIFKSLGGVEKEILLMLVEGKSLREISKSVLMSIRIIKKRIQYIKIVILRIYSRIEK